MRGVVEIQLTDSVVGYYVIKDPAAIARAVKATRRFIESLREQEPSDLHPVGSFSQVSFRGSSRSHAVFSLSLSIFEESKQYVICCMETYYDCPSSAWFDYLRDALAPLTPDLVATWETPGDDDAERRTQLAACLALVAPDTEGLTDYFRETVNTNPRAVLILVFASRAAAPIMEAVANDPKVDAVIRRMAREALNKVRGERQ
jgi:hypothetical protein